jgi:hypothetical protein
VLEADRVAVLGTESANYLAAPGDAPQHGRTGQKIKVINSKRNYRQRVGCLYTPQHIELY